MPPSSPEHQSREPPAAAAAGQREPPGRPPGRSAPGAAPDADPSIARLDRAHRRAREKGVSAPLYALARALLTPLLRLWFRLRVSGAEQIPPAGAAILAPNHKSFLDAFFIGVSTRRHVRFMAKRELFKGLLGRLLLGLGAFPVRRGRSDAQAMETARLILQQGELLVLFPEGTRVEDPHALGSPHHGAGRLALETGAPIVPAAIAGTQRLWLGPLPKPRRVQIAFGAPIDPRPLAGRPDALAEIVDRRLWPEVQRQYSGALARPGLILAALGALGLGVGLLSRRQARAQTRVLGVIPSRKARRRATRRGRRERLLRAPVRMRGALGGVPARARRALGRKGGS